MKTLFASTCMVGFLSGTFSFSAQWPLSPLAGGLKRRAPNTERRAADDGGEDAFWKSAPKGKGGSKRKSPNQGKSKGKRGGRAGGDGAGVGKKSSPTGVAKAPREGAAAEVPKQRRAPPSSPAPGGRGGRGGGDGIHDLEARLASRWGAVKSSEEFYDPDDEGYEEETGGGGYGAPGPAASTGGGGGRGAAPRQPAGTTPRERGVSAGAPAAGAPAGSEGGGGGGSEGGGGGGSRFSVRKPGASVRTGPPAADFGAGGSGSGGSGPSFLFRDPSKAPANAGASAKAGAAKPAKATAAAASSAAAAGDSWGDALWSEDDDYDFGGEEEEEVVVAVSGAGSRGSYAGSGSSFAEGMALDLGEQRKAGEAARKAAKAKAVEVGLPLTLEAVAARYLVRTEAAAAAAAGAEAGAEAVTEAEGGGGGSDSLFVGAGEPLATFEALVAAARAAAAAAANEERGAEGAVEAAVGEISVVSYTATATAVATPAPFSAPAAAASAAAPAAAPASAAPASAAASASPPSLLDEVLRTLWVNALGELCDRAKGSRTRAVDSLRLDAPRTATTKPATLAGTGGSREGSPEGGGDGAAGGAAAAAAAGVSAAAAAAPSASLFFDPDDDADAAALLASLVPTRVQAACAPWLGAGRDALVVAPTGSGKTLAFLLPLLVRAAVAHFGNVDERKRSGGGGGGGGPSVCVVCPGRELAAQSAGVCSRLVEGTPLRCASLLGGANVKRQLETLKKKKPQVVVGTPGRLLELSLGLKRLKLGGVDAMVLDEADALLGDEGRGGSGSGGGDDVAALLRALRPNAQLVVASATGDAATPRGERTRATLAVLRGGRPLPLLHPSSSSPTSPTSSSTTTTTSPPSSSSSPLPATVEHGLVVVPQREMLASVKRLLCTEPHPEAAIVFVDDARRVELVCDKLLAMNVIAAPLHGDTSKQDRADIMMRLSTGRLGLVVTTELAARGLDAPCLSHALNLDLPTDATHYAHRAGRVGRGGRAGIVVSFATPQTAFVVPKLAKALGIPHVPLVTMHANRLLVAPPPPPLPTAPAPAAAAAKPRRGSAEG